MYMHNNYLLRKLQNVPYFEGSLLILAPNLRQGKRFFCVVRVAHRAAFKEILKIGLELQKLRFKVHFLCLKQLNSYKYY